MKKNENFLDSKTILAIALVGITWVGWQSYLTKKYPQTKTPATAETANNPSPTNGTTAAPAKTETSNAGVIEKIKPSEKESFVQLQSKELSLNISSFGMGFKNVTLNNYTSRDKSNVKLSDENNEGLFSLVSMETKAPIIFALNKVNETTFEGVGVDQGVQIKRTITFDSEKYAFQNKISFNNLTPNYKGVSIQMDTKQIDAPASSILSPSFEHQEFFIKTTTTSERINASSTKEDVEKSFASVSISSIGTQYFATAILDNSEVVPESVVKLDHKTRNLHSSLSYKNPGGKSNIDLAFTTFAGPKSYSVLNSVNSELTALINFGFFSAIAKWLLLIMKWFQQFVSNWGLAIIALTLLMRILVLPFNLASYRSMKKMQKIQPALTSIREKYKDDAQAMNRETMALMKTEKVNPIGGCLPMLLQMPIFFALYQVIGQSIELYQAPFFGWIHDLTLKDPFYVLPLLMGATMYMQQKITPTAMDPAQAKILQFLPLVFALMMIALPSGLTLYIFVSTLFGVLQQQLFMKYMSK